MKRTGLVVLTALVVVGGVTAVVSVEHAKGC
jgi:hypothetical protein